MLGFGLDSFSLITYFSETSRSLYVHSRRPFIMERLSVYVIHSQRALLMCLDMFILSPVTYPLMGGVSPQMTSTSSKLLSCIKYFPIDFPVVNKNNIMTYLKLKKSVTDCAERARV